MPFTCFFAIWNGATGEIPMRIKNSQLPWMIKTQTSVKLPNRCCIVMRKEPASWTFILLRAKKALWCACPAELISTPPQLFATNF